MIEQKAIYEAAQTAFSNEHPKFPWPKRHDLEDQTDDFKRAFLHLSTEINAMHEREIESIARRNNELGDKLFESEQKNTNNSYKYDVMKTERDAAKTTRNLALIFATVVIATVGFMVYLGVQIEKCVPQEKAEQFDFRFENSVVAYDMFGNKAIKPICKF